MAHVEKTLRYVNERRISKEYPNNAAFRFLSDHLKLRGKKLINTYKTVLGLIELQQEININLVG